MKIITGVLLSIMLTISPVVLAQDGNGPDESPSRCGFTRGSEGEDFPEEGMPPDSPRHGRHKKFEGKRGHGPGGREAGLEFKQFREEVRELGREIRENELIIQSLEEELAAMEPGILKAEVRKKLNESRLREAELQIALAQKRVDFTRRARDMAQERYDQARLAMEKVKDKIKNDFPDLAGALEPVMEPADGPGPDPEM